MSDTAVIGGGASGLMSAVLCARRNNRVTIFEHNEKISRKLLATGNGKCNFTNTNQNLSFYHSQNPDFVKQVLAQFGHRELLQFFKELGILPKIRDGYCYPYSEQASAVADALRFELEHLKVKVKNNEHVTRIIPENNRFRIITKTYTYEADKVILALGGLAGQGLGADGSGFCLAAELGHAVIPTTPALTGLKSPMPYFSKLSGIRIKAGAGLYINGQRLMYEEGEIQLASYGLSGIPIFQLSRFAARGLFEGKKVMVVLELLPDIPLDSFKNFILEQQEMNGYKSIQMVLGTFLDKKLCEVMLTLAGISPKALISDLSKKQLADVCHSIKNWQIPVKEANPYEKAQVTAGGVDTRQVNPGTMESRLLKGLYFAGEILDVDGACGGYNLQWAFSTGYIAGIHC